MPELSTALRVPAAQYLRMSTEHQRYSLENQRAAISGYAEMRGFAIVQTYADAGKSGLSLKGRDGLQRLLADAVTGQGGFSAILVLDVSRWGRFQDTDQAAHYEFICRNAGVNVHYCGEPFDNDGSMVASIVKNLKRVMAAEYSRELSSKIYRAQIQQACLGFKQGGPVPYGIRRFLISQDGTPRLFLGPGDRKGLKSDRVVFMPGPDEQLKIVRRIFRMFLKQKQSIANIAKTLNDEKIPSTDGDLWRWGRVKGVLRTELMTGYYVFNRTNHKMKNPVRHNPPDLWVRTRVMEPIIDPKTFARVQREFRLGRVFALREPDMIRNLKRLLREKKKLSQAIINNCPYTPSAHAYWVHFGSLQAAYNAAGFICPPTGQRGRYYSDDDLLDGVRRLHAKFGYITIALIDRDRHLPNHKLFIKRFGSVVSAYGLAGFPTTMSESVSAARQRAAARSQNAHAARLTASSEGSKP
ncbi:recombinase family protein [Mesorhizobium sp. BR1-1-12]|uniref:recombinase family protein n=1 Tax=unclassified Mesorhizobium TaxID=325217 RepID=UPI001CCA95FE|nr:MULTISPECIES: recombinase family protein [unclassified Mesorhizobium]MBZ9919087.1 recombinase family protein [Mesorhizobium sp. BR1-1-7]MBZ9970134.1 recombinase family protein [Mesorhizobium sp. BR1-1-12]